MRYQQHRFFQLIPAPGIAFDFGDTDGVFLQGIFVNKIKFRLLGSIKIFIRKIFNDACRMDLIEPQDNPLLKFTLKTEKTQRVYLTESELKAMEKCPLDENSKQAVHRDAFIFSAYAGGLRISDVLLLKPEHFDGSHINFTIRKTKSQLSIKLPNTALAIVKKYLERKPENNAYLFALLPDDLDENDPFTMDRKISSASVTANKSLKAIAKKAGITKHLSFHISRHTWATQALRKGIFIDKVSRLMGHANIRETQIYAKIVSEELDKAMEVFND